MSDDYDDDDRVFSVGTIHPALRRRQQRTFQAMVVALSAMIGLISALALTFRQEITGYSTINPIWLLFTAATGVVLAVSLLLFVYLRGWVTDRPLKGKGLVDYFAPGAVSSGDRLVAEFSDRLEALEQGPSAPVGVTPSDVAQMLLPHIQTDLAKVFEAKYEKKSMLARAAALNGERYNAAVKRLEREIIDQGRKGNVNLSIGFFTTMLAVGLLGWIVLGQESRDWAKVDPTWTQMVAHYVPRLSLVVFIEVFSFFFLRLYKATLEEARRYNDDLTRLTIQWVATETGMHAEEKGAIAALAKELLAVSKPPKLASAEAVKPALDGDKLLKAVVDAVSKQLGEKAKAKTPEAGAEAD